MNKDLIETPRFICSLGNEVFLKGRIVGFDVDDYNFVENVVRLEYGQTLNIPNSNIYTTDNIIDKCKIKVKVPQFMADWIEYFKKYSGSLYGSTAPYSYYGHAITDDFVGDVKKTLGWIRNNSETYARAWLDGYEVEKEKRYLVSLKNGQPLVKSQLGNTFYFNQNITAGNYKVTRKELEDAGFGWVFDCPGIEIEEVDDEL